jgi:fructosamine-3-kinase
VNLLTEHGEQAMLARHLATVATDADIVADASDALVRRRPALADLNRFYDALGFGDALRVQAARLDQSMAEVAPDGGARRLTDADAAALTAGSSAPRTHGIAGASLALFPRPATGDGDGWEAIAAAVREDGGPRLLPDDVRPVAGGCIHGSYRVRGEDGWYFVKRNGADQLPVLRAEAQGLRALLGADVLRVPRPWRCGADEAHAWLVMEWLELGKLERSGARRLGEALAHLHRVRGDRFGWHEDNFIGATPQANGWSHDWPEFFRDRRLLPQLRLAHERGYRGRLQQDGEQLAGELEAIFDGHRPVPSLLHGDLWAGNCAADDQGRPVLFDPAVHYGDRECDLAMADLFGGFDRRFYTAYDEVLPRPAGYERRRDLYQLYHVLNHLNLFGGGYLAHAERLLRDLLRAC